MQTQKNSSNKKTNAKTSAKAKKVEEESPLKKQGIKVQFEDLKKQVEKFKIVPDNTRNDDETSTTNPQTSISFDKNEVLEVAKEPKIEDITMKDLNKNTDTKENLQANTGSSEVKPLILDDDDEYDVITVKANQPIQESKVKPLILDDDDEYDIITVRVNQPVQVTTNETKMVSTNEKTPIQTNSGETKAVIVHEKQPIQTNDTNRDIIIGGGAKGESQDREVHIKTHDEKKKELSNETELIDAETKRVNSIEAQKQAKRAAIKNLFEATGGNIPKLFDEVNTELKALMKVGSGLKMDPVNFSSELDAYRIPNFASSYQLDPTKDFYGMGIAEQDLLFERVGLFKGIVVDYNRENAIEQGYRNAVKFVNRPIDNNTEKPVTQQNRSKPVKVFSKKPRYSGFFESSIALDEYQRKSQEAGIVNLGFGLSASYSKGFVSAAVKAGYAYNKESFNEVNTKIKKISMIASFYLPKIELSFDTLQPCAADDLIEYLERALEKEQDTFACFKRINTILLSFGQFVPTSMFIGAKIYHSKTHELKATDIINEVASKHEAHFQASVSTAVFEGGIEAKTRIENTSKDREQSKSERESVEYRAIGGEGAVISDMGKWVESTADAMRWGLIRYDDLVPVIDLLPYDLQERITDVFDRVVAEYKIQDILSIGAHFLFHRGYFERFGSKAQPKFSVIKNSSGHKQVLSVRVDDELDNNKEVIMSQYDGADVGDVQEWYIANSGKIHLKNHPDSDTNYVLSIDSTSKPPKLVITQEDSFDHQLWDVRGGMMYNISDESYVTFNGSQIAIVKNKDEAKSNTWLFVSEKAISTQSPSRRKNVTEKKSALMLSEGGVSDILDNNYYLPLNGMLKSINGVAQLNFTSGKIAILWGKGAQQKEIWSRSIANPAAAKFGIINGTLAILDETDTILEEIATDIVDIRLTDSGNLEGINIESSIVYESGSIVYAYIQAESSRSVLSIMPSQNGNYKQITSMPYFGGEHQLWYINRKNNIVSKYTNGINKYALTEIIEQPVSNPVFPFSATQQPTQSGGSKTSSVVLDVLSAANANAQQWEGLAPNRKGNLSSKTTKNIVTKGLGPNEQWVLTYDVNAKQEANMPLVSYSSQRDLEFTEIIYRNELSYFFKGIDIKGYDIRAVRFAGGKSDEYWDDQRYYTLRLQFMDSYGKIYQSSQREDPKAFYYGLTLPDLSGAAYFHDEDQSLNLNVSHDYNNRKGTFTFSTEKRGFPGGSIFVNPYGYDKEDILHSISNAWVIIPPDHKAIGVSFCQVSASLVSPCLISVKR